MFIVLAAQIALAPPPGAPGADTTAPAVEIVDPEVAVVAFGAPYRFPVTVAASDEDSGLKSVALYVQGGLFDEVAAGGEFVFDLELGPGLWALTAEATDVAGNLATTNSRFVRVIDEGGSSSGGSSSGGEPDEFEGSTGDCEDEPVEGSSGGAMEPEGPGQGGGTSGCAIGGQSELACALGVLFAFVRRRRKQVK